MNKRKERSEGVEVSYNEQFAGGYFDMYGFGEKRRNLNDDCYNGKQRLEFIADICEKENSCRSSSSAIGGDDNMAVVGAGPGARVGEEAVSGAGAVGYGGLGLLDAVEEERRQAGGQHLAQKYQSLQSSHATLQKVVKSLLDKLSQLNELCSQKDRELAEHKVQIKKLVEANETLKMYIQSSHSSLMSNSIINKFGSDIY